MTRVDGSASAEIAELRRRLRADEVSFLDKYAGRIDAIERARPWFVAGGVVGAAVVGFGRFIEGTPGIVVSTIGIVAALIFGGLVGWADFRKLEISREARSAMTVADDALDRAGRYATALDEQTRRRELRGDRLVAGSVMREAIATAVANGLGMGDAIDSMLDGAKLRLIAACDFEAAEYWAITVFALDEVGDEMGKIAALWNDATTSAQASRTWRKGEGARASLGGTSVPLSSSTWPRPAQRKSIKARGASIAPMTVKAIAPRPATRSWSMGRFGAWSPRRAIA